MELKKNNNKIINKSIENNNDIIVGIYLGTNYSCISIFKNGSPNLILDQFGEYLIPSIIAFENNIDPPFLGQMAKFKAEDEKNLLIFDTKRLIGKSYDDINIKKDNFPFELIKDQKTGRIKIKLKLPKKIIDKNNNNNISYEEKEFSIELITSIIIKHLKNIAENELKTKINRAVISVPTSFNDIERELIKKAGEMAGFKVGLINEPSAAALAYGFKENNNLFEEEKILVFNLGSGTFEVSLILLDFSDSKEIEVLATNENLNFCGRNIDYKLLEECLGKINKNNNKINIKENSNVIFKLLNECEKVKNILSSKTSATIKIKNLFYNEDFEITFSKEQFEKQFENECKNTIEKLINDSIKNKKIKSTEEIKKIILLGENSKIPFIKNLLENYFKNSEFIYIPKEFISFGACLQGEIIKNSEELKTFSLLEVTTFSLGIELKNGKFSEIIKKNSGIKNKKEKIYRTTSDYQKKILLSIYEGENEYVKNNHFLGNFEYKNFPILPKGEVKIRVFFEIDFDNILKISVVDENKNEFVFDKNYFFDDKNNFIDLIKNENVICIDDNSNIKINKSNEENKIFAENLNIVNKENKNNNIIYNNNDFEKYKNNFINNNYNFENSELDIENFSLNTFNTFDSNNFNDEKKEESNYFFNDLINGELKRKFQNENPEKFKNYKNEFENFGLNFINIIIKKYDNNKKYFNINIEEEYKKNPNEFLNKIKKIPNINEKDYSIIVKICNNLI